jgi:hypothetical protein
MFIDLTPPLILAGLQRGVLRRISMNRFNGFPHEKPLKGFARISQLPTPG